MKSPPIVLGYLSLLACSGCATLQVKRGSPPKSAPGLPFYIKKAACLHTVTWLEPVYNLTLELVTVPDGAAAKPVSRQVGSTSLSLSQFRGEPAKKLFDTLNAEGPLVPAVVRAWGSVATQAGAPYTPSGFPEAKDRMLVTNTSEPQVYVDYKDPYYLNVKRPIAGTAKIDNKLASDGTLTEVSVEVEDKTIEAIGTAIKDITSAVGGVAKGENLTPTQQYAKLTISTGGYRHSFSKVEPSASLPCPANGTEIAEPRQYLRTEVGAAEKKPDAKADAKTSKITVSGEIVLPDTKPASNTGSPPASSDPTKVPAAPAPATPKKVKK